MPISDTIKDYAYISGNYIIENLGFLGGIPGLTAQIYLRNKDGRRPYRMHKVGKCENEQCAAWANSQMRKIGREVYGDAWNTTGVTVFADGYSGLERPQTFNYNDVQKYNGKAAQNLKNTFNISSLNKNRLYMANMYYNDSSYARQAFDNGSGASHIGVIRFDPNDNKWYVEHNYHGDLMKDPLEDLLGNRYNMGITRILKKQGGKLIPRKNK